MYICREKWDRIRIIKQTKRYDLNEVLTLTALSEDIAETVRAEKSLRFVYMFLMVFL